VFVAAPRPIYTVAERQRRLEPVLQNLVREALALGFCADDVQKLVHAQFRRMTAGKDGEK
jgi:hypothetical protein